MAVIVAIAGVFAYAPRQTPPLKPTQIPIDNIQLDDIARTKAGVVVAGELGNILVSPDDGKTWTSASLPRQRDALITRLVFSDQKTGFALGHEGWILKTVDGGLTWKETAFDKKDGEPFMAAVQLSSGDWLAIGAFGRTVRSTDGGASWQPVEIPGIEDSHLNAIASSDDHKTLVIAGEAGLIMTSTDGGNTWKRSAPFYQGSFYGAVFLGGTDWVIYGMRGTVYHSSDNGVTWSESSTPGKFSMYGDAVTQDGHLLLVGQGGVIMESTDKGRHFKIIREGGDETLTGILPKTGSGWLLSSSHGLLAFTPTAAKVAGS